jgi:hypothetical protein
LKRAFIRIDAHLAAQRIHLTCKLPLRLPTHCGVAREIRNTIIVHCEQHGPATHARGRKRRFATSMPRPDHDYVHIQ